MSTVGGHDAWLRHEAVFDRFEQAWQNNGRPRIEDFLPHPGDPDRLRILQELIQIELEYLSSRGEKPIPTDYLARFPELAEATLPSLPTRKEPIGRRLGHYELKEAVGQGSFATVYRAWDPKLRREVAVKVPRVELSAFPESRSRTLREAQAAARLRHPAIVTLHEVGQEGDATYLVYDFIPGPTLAHLLRTTRPAPEQAARWVARLAEALDYAHQQGIVHRDVKPANIMTDADGQPLLADFGMARPVDAATLTQEGDVLGTPAYMPPEQAAGRTRQIDGRSDVYSLGVLLYEMLSGKLPFAGEVADVLYRVVHDEPPPPRQHRSGVPLDLETICLKAMAKEPSRRYQTAGELADDLRRYLGHQTIRARRRGPIGRLTLWCRRHPALTGTILVATLVTVTVAAIGFWQVVQERDHFRAERDRAEANLYRSLVSDAQAQLRGRDTGWWWKAMDNIRDAAKLEVSSRDPVALRELAIQCMGSQYPCFRLQAEWDGHDGPVLSVAVSPDGTLAASASSDRTVRLWSLPSGQPLAVLSAHTKAVLGVAFHPQGRQLASCSADGMVRSWDIGPLKDYIGSGGDPSQLPLPAMQVHDLQGGAVRAVAFSPNGADLAAACRDGIIRILPAAGDAAAPAVRTWKGHTAAVSCLAFTSDGTKLASGSDDATIRFWDGASGKPTMTWATPRNKRPLSLAWYPKGDVLAISDSESFGFHRRHLQDDGPQGRDHLHTGSVTQLACDRQGRVLTASSDGSLKLWPGRDFTELAVASGDFAGCMTAAFSSDDRWVAVGYRDGKVRLWEFADPPHRYLGGNNSQNAVFVGSERRLVDNGFSMDFTRGLPGTSKNYFFSPVHAVTVHPDGRRFALAKEDGLLQVWDWQRRAELLSWQGHGQQVSSLATSPDGKFLASTAADGQVKLWHWDTGELFKTLEAGLGPIHQVAWSRDGRQLAATGVGGVVVWDLAEGASPRTLSHQALLESGVAFGVDVMACCGADHGVEIREARSGRTRHVLRGHRGIVSAVAFSPDGGTLATAARDHTIRVWDVGTGKQRFVLEPQDWSMAPSWLAFEPGGRYLLSGALHTPTKHSACLLWDLQTRTAVASLAPSYIPCACFLADGSGILRGSREGGVLLATMAEIDQVRADARGRPEAIPLLDQVPDAARATVVPGSHVETIWGVAASPDGRWIATSSHDETVKLWDARTMKLVRTMTGHVGLVWCVAFSPDSKLLASGGAAVKVWDVATGQETQHIEDHTAMVSALAFHPDGRWLASAGLDGAVCLRDVPAEKSLGVLHQFRGGVHSLAFHPSGRWLAGACHDQGIALWSFDPPAVPTAPDRILEGHTAAVRSVGFSADGRYLASGSEQGTIILWDGETFSRVVTLKGGTGQVRCLSFSRDGRLLAGAAYVAPTIVWDLEALRRTLRKMNLDW